ncbi:hypothetical protein ACPA3B_24270 [Bacillus bombysepticus]
MILLTAWYDAKITHTLIGASISIIVMVVTQLILSKREKRKERQTLLNWLLISNNSLFSTIYKNSKTPKNIEYNKLREELEKNTSFIYILPADLKADFVKLYDIHFKGSSHYTKNQQEIAGILASIVKKINTYGGEAFGE